MEPSKVSFRDWLTDRSWDAPFFKRLPFNDTGKAPGHSGAFVIPKELRAFFPYLDEKQTTVRRPTVDLALQVSMYIGRWHVADSEVRYQFQTWRATRTPEARLTGNLGPVRDEAAKSDLLIIQRGIESLDKFRLILVRKTSPEFESVNKQTQGRQWGPLFPTETPVTQMEIAATSRELIETANHPFSVLKSEVHRVETLHQRILRDVVFAITVRKEYGERCCVSGVRIETPGRLFEVEAAHVVPVGAGGTDDPRNGLALCRTLHWAFDRGLFGIRSDRKVYLPQKVRAMENVFLKQYEGKIISEAKTPVFRVHPEALAWHFQKYVESWE